MVTKQSFPLVKTENNTKLSPNEPKNLYFVHMVHIHFVYTALVKEWGTPPPTKVMLPPPTKVTSPVAHHWKTQEWKNILLPYLKPPWNGGAPPPSNPLENVYDYATLYLAMLTSSTCLPIQFAHNLLHQLHLVRPNFKPLSKIMEGRT